MGLAHSGPFGMEVLLPFPRKIRANQLSPQGTGWGCSVERVLWMSPQPAKLWKTPAPLPFGPSPCIPTTLDRGLPVSEEGAPDEGQGLGSGLEPECASSPGASCPLLGITLLLSVLSLEPVGHGLTRGLGGPLLGTQTLVCHPVAL